LLAQTPTQAQLPRPGILAQQLTKTGAFLGTPNYMAPEQLLRRATDARSDQFSFCIAFYEGLYGQRPFQGDSLEGLAAEIVAGQIKEPPNSRGTPSWVRRILLRGLRAESDERYPSMDGLLLALERGRARSNVLRRLRAVWISATGIALLLLVTLGLNLGGSRDRLIRQQHIQSIAVLPLKNASGDSSQQYLVDGMTDALISNLSQIGNLRVIPWTASTQHADESPREIGRQLNVDVVVRGSVLRVGTRVQVTGQLVHAATNLQFWARSYERELQDVLALQGDVAQDIANEFRVKLSSSERARLATTLQVNPEAYENYLEGHFHALRQNDTDYEIAINLLERAVSLDPAFARAYADLGRAYGLRLYYFHPEDKGLEEKAFVAVEKAIALDPNLAEAHLARAYAVWTPSNHFPHEQAAQACRRALALNPNLDEARDHLAAIYLHIGLLDKALEESQRAVTINPTNVPARYRVGVVFHHQGRYEEALAILKTVPKDFNPALASRQIAWTLFSLGKREEAAAIIEAFFRDNPRDTGGLVTSVQAMLLAAAGNRTGAEEKIKAALGQRKGFGHFHHSAYNIGSAYALMNEPGLALQWLREAANDGYPCYPLFEKDASLNNLRTDSRFIQFMADLNRQWNQYKAKL